MSASTITKWFFQAISHKVTLKITTSFAEKLPVYFVCGYPRSGTSWLSDILAIYYNLPKPKHYYLPIAFSSIIHTHDLNPKTAKNTFYIIRDCRNAYVSMFNYIIYKFQHDQQFRYSKKYYRILELNKQNIQHSFFLFVNSQINKRNNWGAHVREWLKFDSINNNYTIIKYEDLLANPYECLKHSIYKLDNSVNEELLQYAIYFNSLEIQKIRPISQHTTHISNETTYKWHDLTSPETELLITTKYSSLLAMLDYA